MLHLPAPPGRLPPAPAALARARGLLLLGVLLGCAGAPHAQPQAPLFVVSTEALGERPARIIDWRQRDGDDPAWAGPGYDDRSWELVRLGGAVRGAWSGNSWVRTRIRLDSSLAGVPVGFDLIHTAASEVYLDGRLLYRIGRVARTAEAETLVLRTTARLLPLRPGVTHLLAVRLSYHTVFGWGWARPTVLFWVGRLDRLVDNRARDIARATTRTASNVGILLTLCLLNLVVFALFREEKGNLYFALFTASLAVALVGAHGTIDWWTDWLLYRHLLSLGTLAFGIAGIRLLREVYGMPPGRSFYVLCAVAAGLFLWALASEAEAYRPIGLFLVVPLLEWLRLTILALRRWGRRVALSASGMLVLVLAGARYVLDALGVWPLDRTAVNLIYAGLYFTLATMSVHLARNIAHTNRSLGRQLRRVRELSAELTEREVERRLLEAENARKAEALERAKELERAYGELKRTQAQLVQQEKLASLGQLTAGIAHEIKNPLNFVNNFAALSVELTREIEEVAAADPALRVADVRDLLTDVRLNAEKIAEHGRRADSIVRNMLDHSHGGSGRREPVDVNALVEKYASLAYHGRRAQRPGFACRIEQRLDPAAGRVEMVAQEMGRVLVNLLGNAFDAVHEKRLSLDGPYEPAVTVSTRRLEGEVEIRVEDDGPGMPEEVRRKVFEPFFTTKPPGEGTGLGLSLSHDIVVAGHGGSLEVESREGEGAAFVVRLPAAGRVREAAAPDARGFA